MKKHHRHGALMRYASILGFGDIRIKIDPKTGLHAIIAIHSNDLGPAIGGCRCYPYASTGEATKDVLRLAYMMTLKAAVCKLPHGGAKAVIIKPRKIKDERAFFESFGDFVNQAEGRYITACDVGTSTTEMNIIAESTPYVIGATSHNKKQSNPAQHTALGVLRGIQATVKHKLKRDDLEKIKINIQGLGQVGYELARLLTTRGAIITATDTKIATLEQCRDELGINIAGIDEIYDIPSDVFAPCALGGTINPNTLKRIQTSIIAGSANNQLSHSKCIQLIEKKDILYAPDYVVNAGGLINAAIVYDYNDPDRATAKINELYETTLELCERAANSTESIIDITRKIALDRIKQGSNNNKTINSTIEEVN